MLVFAALLTCLSRAVSELPLGLVAAQVFGYSVLGGTVMFAVSGALRQLALTPLGIALASLPVGAGIYIGVLAVAHDRTFATLLRVSREWLVARRAVSG